MNKIEEQILKNQVDIMRNLINRTDYIGLRLQETSDLLNPQQSNEPCCDMSEEEQEAYDLGISRVKEGATKVNCNFTIFSTPEKTKAWEKGVQFAKRGLGE